MKTRIGHLGSVLLVLGLALLSSVGCVPPEPPTGEPPASCPVNDVVVRVWSHDRDRPAYLEWNIPREKVVSELPGLLDTWSVRDSTARIEVINRHCAVDALPPSSPGPSC